MVRGDRERELSIGGVGAVPLDLSDGFAHAALEHSHGRQMLSETVRYSDSPLAYSFSEARHERGGGLLEVGPDGLEFSADGDPHRQKRRCDGRRGHLLAPACEDAVIVPDGVDPFAGPAPHRIATVMVEDDPFDDPAFGADFFDAVMVGDDEDPFA